jgi:hypothetical protein
MGQGSGSTGLWRRRWWGGRTSGMLRRRLFPTAGPACGVVQLVQRHVQRGKHELVLSLSSPTWCVALLSSMRRESVAQRRAVRVRWGHDDDEHSASLNRFRDGMPVQFAYCLLVPGATTCMHAAKLVREFACSVADLGRILVSWSQLIWNSSPWPLAAALFPARGGGAAAATAYGFVLQRSDSWASCRVPVSAMDGGELLEKVTWEDFRRECGPACGWCCWCIWSSVHLRAGTNPVLGVEEESKQEFYYLLRRNITT